VPNPVKISSASFIFTPSKIILENLEGKFGKSTVKVKGDISNYMSFITKVKK